MLDQETGLITKPPCKVGDYGRRRGHVERVRLELCARDFRLDDYVATDFVGMPSRFTRRGYPVAAPGLAGTRLSPAPFESLAVGRPGPHFTGFRSVTPNSGQERGYVRCISGDQHVFLTGNPCV